MRERRAIERAQGGDLAALEPVLAQHAESLFACVLGRVGERAQAEDLLKDTFLTTLERIQGFVWQDRSIYHWLRQIALNKVLDHHRAVGRRKRMCQVLRDELTATAEPQTPAPSAALSAEEERRIAQQPHEPLRPRPALFRGASPPAPPSRKTGRVFLRPFRLKARYAGEPCHTVMP